MSHKEHPSHTHEARKKGSKMEHLVKGGRAAIAVACLGALSSACTPNATTGTRVNSSYDVAANMQHSTRRTEMEEEEARIAKQHKARQHRQDQNDLIADKR